jgi:aspartate beta-hydroxylase
MDDAELNRSVRAARELMRAGQTATAVELLERAHRTRPDAVEAGVALSRALCGRGDTAGAERALGVLQRSRPRDEIPAVELAVVRMSAGEPRHALQGLSEFVQRNPDSPLAWLLLGQLHEGQGHRPAALISYLEAISRAHAAGAWLRPEQTPAHMVAAVSHAAGALRQDRREVFTAVVESMRHDHPPSELRRLERSIAGYLKEREATPADPMQRPRVLYFQDLPTAPYMDPALQPWSGHLLDAYRGIRDEAAGLILGGEGLEDFIRVKQDDHISNYLGGTQPSWEAHFFYRHGQRYDASHARCPVTSAALESLDLARIPGQTPEICFSVLAPETTILPHHGVTNARSVMHLPLLVPSDCALHLVDRGVHHWQEGELVMFDDTFLHEAWNRSKAPRVILLMDCWNPHLTPVERHGLVRLCQAIGILDIGSSLEPWSAA